MPRGSEISDQDKGKIKAYHDLQLSIREISARIGIPKSTVADFIKKIEGNLENVGKSKPGPKCLLGNRDKRRILRQVSNSDLSANLIKRKLDLNCSSKTVLRVINASPNMTYLKKKSKPPLNKVHKEQRLSWARNHMSWTSEWNNVIFSDEKKFNFDGPDGFAYYWHDIRKETICFSKRQHAGGSVMVWASIGYNGRSQICFLNSRLDSAAYIRVLENYLLPQAEEMGGVNFEFQQDNAPCHSSKFTNAWLNQQNIKVMKWPSRSPDLNIMENLWGILVRSVYANSRHFQNTEDLQCAIVREWNNIDRKVIEKLFKSMQNRVFEVIKAKGSSTKY